MKSVFLDYATMGSGDLDLAALQTQLPGIEVFDNTLAAESADRIRHAEAVFCNKVRLDAEVLRTATALKFIGLAATGTDNVDLAYAKEHGIAVCNLIGYCTQSVVEHVFATLLSLAHNIQPYNRLVRAGGWAKANNFCALQYPVRQLSSMTLGIVGYGALGRGVADLGRAFGMQILVARRRGATAAPDDSRHDLDYVLRNADALTLHCPLNDDTRHLIDAAALGRMKTDAILINTARGGLVDSAALADALANGDIGAAAVDVLPQEPPVDGDPLLDYSGDNLIITPHTAWATRDARQAAIDGLAANYAAFVAGERRNRVV